MDSRRQMRLSLDLLRGFEAAARHLSFTRAAGELFVTQAAISHQIKTLEKQLGQPLFSRVNRDLGLTNAGQELYRGVREGFELIDEATRRAAGYKEGRTLTVTISVPLASLWLAPRLPHFVARHREVDMRIVAADKALDLARERIDIAIRRYPSGEAPQDAPLLFPMKVFPVCAPALVRDRTRPLKSPGDLRHHMLLELDPATARPAWLDWPGWLRAMKLDRLRAVGMLGFSHYDQLIEAVIGSAGVALGRYPHITRLLHEGRLVAPFDRDAVVNLGAYHIIRAPGSAGSPLIEDFVEWLHEQVREDAERMQWRETDRATRASSSSGVAGRRSGAKRARDGNPARGRRSSR
jgi:LysR family transcriptional regulator, glycine cleavage system transcriptional activator